MPPLKMPSTMTVDQAISDFLSQKRIAIAGVSLEGEGKHGANMIYRRLKEHGYQVFAVNPDPWDPDGGTAYRTLSAIPDGVDAVVIATEPDRAAAVVAECWQMGITKVWIHDGFGERSVTESAHEACRQAGIDCIAGGCPLMYGQTSDFAHRLGRLVLGAAGRIPRSM